MPRVAYPLVQKATGLDPTVLQHSCLQPLGDAGGPDGVNRSAQHAG